MHLKLTLILPISIILFNSCKKVEEISGAKIDKELINNSLTKAINNGSREDFILAENEFSKLKFSTEKFYYSYLVATKYEFPEAYFSLFECLKPNKETKGNKIEIQNFGTESEAFRYYFLLKSFELVKKSDPIYPIIKKEVEEKFGLKNKIPNSKDFLIKKL